MSKGWVLASLSTALLGAACSSPAPAGQEDGGAWSVDGGGLLQDGGARSVDGGGLLQDGGARSVDGGSLSEDAGAPCPDAGCPCQPGERRCVAGTRVEVCSTEQHWVLEETCDAESGRSCDNPLGRCLTACEARLSEISNLGCIFWPVVLANYGNEGYDSGPSGPRYAGVRLSVSNPNAETVTLSLSDRYTSFDLGNESTVPAQGSVSFVLPPVAAESVADRHVVDGSTIAYAAFRLQSSAPVFVTQFNPADTRIASSDASLLLPENTLGTTYYPMSVPHSTKQVDSSLFHRASGFVVVATKDDTTVTVHAQAPTAPLAIAAHETEVLAEGHPLAPLAAGETRSFRLNAYEVLSLETAPSSALCPQDKPTDPVHGRICVKSDDFARGLGCYVYGRRFCQPGPDLTGSLVTANKPVAVFSTAKNAMVPFYMFGTEHLEEQVPPLSAWGRSYVLGRIAPRYRYYTCSRGNLLGTHLSTCPFGSGVSIYRVLAATDGTVVTIDTPTAPVTIEEAPRDYNVYGQTDWTTSPVDPVHWGSVAGRPCLDDGGTCRVEVSLNAGEVLELRDVFNHHISATHAILVQRLIPGEEYVGIPGAIDPSPYVELLWRKGGDPAMTYVVPVGQFRNQYAIHVVGELAYGYLGLVAPRGARIVLDEGTASEVVLDTSDGTWEPVGANHLVRFYEIHNLSPRDRPREVPDAGPGTLKRGGGMHTLRGLDGVRFGVEVYGFDHYVSYAYPGGLALLPINKE
jgi:hypothetical protein